MNIVDIMIIAATVLAAAFPYFLIKAIRSDDEEVSSNSGIAACLLFGAVVFITLCIINS